MLVFAADAAAGAAAGATAGGFGGTSTLTRIKSFPFFCLVAVFVKSITTPVG